jgi:uncharacterized protein YeaO (DUF488 family)
VLGVRRPFADKLIEHGCEVAQFVQVSGPEAVQPCLPVGGEHHPGQPPVLGVTGPRDNPRVGRPVHQLDHAVVAQQQVLGELGDRRILAPRVALDRDEKLVLGRGQADRARLRLAPVQEPAQARAERQQILEVPSRHFGHLFTVAQLDPDLASSTRTPPRGRAGNSYRVTIYYGRQPSGLPGRPVAGRARWASLTSSGRQISMTATTDVRVRRVYDPPDPADGHRVLVDRLWPRGLSKGAAALDEWVKAVAPSDELRRWYGHEVDKFPAFRERYAAELQAPERAEALAHLRHLADSGPLTLLTATRDVEHSQAAVLAERLRGAR